MTSVNSTLPYSLILDEEGILKNTLISSNPAVTTDREEQCNGSDSALTQSNGGSMTETSLSLTHSGILKKPSSGINQSSYATVRLSKVKFTDETNDKETVKQVAAQGLNHSTNSGEDNDTALLLEPLFTEETAKDRPKPQRHPPRLRKLKSELNMDHLAKSEIELKANLYFHISNPLKRWRVERVIPIKLILQIIKTFCLIVQVSIFTITIAHQRGEFFYNSREVFENHFLLNFTEEVPRGIYPAFSIQELFDNFDHICDNYYKLPSITIGGYDFKMVDDKPSPVKITLRQYRVADLNAKTFTYTLDGRLKTTTFFVNEGERARELYINYSNDPLFNRFYDMVFSFPINNIRIVHQSRAECFSFIVRITFESDHDSGKIFYFLRETHLEQECKATVLISSFSLSLINGCLTSLDVIVIIMSLLSIFLIFSTLKRAIKLARAMGAFYRDQLGIELSWFERRSLFSSWHFLNFTSDVIILIGTAYKIALTHYIVFMASPTRVLLGTAVLLQAGVILRYVSYFKKFNALNRTLYLAFPELLKFMLCVWLLFVAFSLTGYIVLGPFHPKFATFYESFESLFGLLNGDDIAASFDKIDIDDDRVAYLYSRVFLYAFLVLFIYFVLNLFTSLVIAAYEASKHKDNAMKNEVRRFVFSGPLTPNGVALRDVTLTKKYVDPQVILQRKEKRRVRSTFSIVDGFTTSE